MPLCTPDSVCHSCQKKSAEFTVALNGVDAQSIQVCNRCLRPAIYWGYLFGGADVVVGPYYGMDVCDDFDAEEA